MKLTIGFLGVPRHYHQQIFERWKVSGYPDISKFAPYAQYILEIDIFFYIAAASSLIAKERVSNKIDLAYLYYLPFCTVFVSSDKLHKRCAPLFLRSNQRFIWGHELKKGLKQLDKYYDDYPDSEKEKGLFHFANRPPGEKGYYVSGIWDQLSPGWRDRYQPELPLTQDVNDNLVAQLNAVADATPLDAEAVDFDTANPESMVLRRKIRPRRGKWVQYAEEPKKD